MEEFERVFDEHRVPQQVVQGLDRLLVVPLAQELGVLVIDEVLVQVCLLVETVPGGTGGCIGLGLRVQLFWQVHEYLSLPGMHLYLEGGSAVRLVALFAELGLGWVAVGLHRGTLAGG